MSKKLFVVPMFMTTAAETEGDADQRVAALQALALQHGFSLFQDEVLPITRLEGDPDAHEIHTVVDHSAPLQNAFTLLLEIEAALKGTFIPGGGSRLEAAMKMAQLAGRSLYGIQAGAVGGQHLPWATLTLTTADECVGNCLVQVAEDGVIKHSEMSWSRSSDMETVSAVIRRGNETLSLDGDQWRDLEDRLGDAFWRGILIDGRPLSVDLLATAPTARPR